MIFFKRSLHGHYELRSVSNSTSLLLLLRRFSVVYGGALMGKGYFKHGGGSDSSCTTNQSHYHVVQCSRAFPVSLDHCGVRELGHELIVATMYMMSDWVDSLELSWSWTSSPSQGWSFDIDDICAVVCIKSIICRHEARALGSLTEAYASMLADAFNISCKVSLIQKYWSNSGVVRLLFSHAYFFLYIYQVMTTTISTAYIKEAMMGGSCKPDNVSLVPRANNNVNNC